MKMKMKTKTKTKMRVKRRTKVVITAGNLALPNRGVKI